MICRLLSEDLPELDIISSSIDGGIEMVLSTEFSCPGDACLGSSDRLFNTVYAPPGDVIARNTARNQARTQCTAGNGKEVAELLCV